MVFDVLILMLILAAAGKKLTSDPSWMGQAHSNRTLLSATQRVQAQKVIRQSETEPRNSNKAPVVHTFSESFEPLFRGPWKNKVLNTAGFGKKQDCFVKDGPTERCP